MPHIQILADQLAVTLPTPEAPEVVTTMAAAERQHIIFALNKVGWTIAGKGGAAELLDLPPSTLRSRMKKLSIDKSSYDIPRRRDISC